MKSEITTGQASELIKSISLWQAEEVTHSWSYYAVTYCGYWYPSVNAALYLTTRHYADKRAPTAMLYDHDATLLWSGEQSLLPDISDSIY